MPDKSEDLLEVTDKSLTNDFFLSLLAPDTQYTMPKKILYTIPNFITAGSGRALLNIAERLDRNKYIPSICIEKSGGRLEEEIKQKGIPLLEAPFTVKALPYYQLPFRAWKAARFFRPYKFDIWHSFHYLDDYTEAIIARLAGAKRWVYTKKNMNWHRRAWHVRSLLASAIAAQNTDMMRDFFSSGRYAKKTRLIPRGVDLEKFSPGHSACLGLRKKFQIPQDEGIVGTVGHLVPVKGIPTLLQAMRELPNAHLLVAGRTMDDDYFQELQQMCKDPDLQERVHFCGDVSDVPPFLAELDVFVLPTWAKWRMEGCPVALLEAMACGKPCIATDIPGSRDIIQEGINGILVPPESSESLAAALKKLLEDSQYRNSLAKKARERIEQNYSIALEVIRHEELYDSLLCR